MFFAYLRSAGWIEYFFIRTRTISLLLAIRTAKTKSRIFEQLFWMAEVTLFRIAVLSGSTWTVFVRVVKTLFVTEKIK